jgi:hypothetical protein
LKRERQKKRIYNKKRRKKDRKGTVKIESDKENNREVTKEERIENDEAC